MIPLLTGPIPPVLSENQREWTLEYLQWIENRSGVEPSRYRHVEIRVGLRLETGEKCAYCEGLIRDVSFDHIEHKLPKKKVPNLVCDWDNLTIACAVCNIRKSDYFDPVAPLLDPFNDDVAESISFYGPMALPRGGSASRMTINKLDLNRKDLLAARERVLKSLDLILDLLERDSVSDSVAKELWSELDTYIGADSEFSSCCRYFVQAQVSERKLSRPCA